MISAYYIHDVAILKKFNEGHYKLTVCKSVRSKGSEGFTKKRGVNSKKLDNNISRAKSKVREYALCNDFDYFVTLTIDKDKYDRHDFKAYYKALGQFLLNYGKNHKSKIRYVLIPEMHEDGAWHMHGLIGGVLDKHLEENSNGYLEWKQYTKKFGYMSLGVIKDKNKVASYITKYITKEMGNTVGELEASMYYCSKGLKCAEEIKRGTLFADNIPFDFVNDYVKIKTFYDDSITNLIR